MRKSSRIWLIAAAWLVILGAMIFVGAMFAMHWDFSNLSTFSTSTLNQRLKNIFIKKTTIFLNIIISFIIHII